MKYSKIFVYLPGRIPCGGAELAHQLVDYLRKHEKDAFMVYGDDQTEGKAHPVMECYSKYNIAASIQIEDSAENVLVLPETAYGLAKKYTNIQIACWWMSVDNFVQHELHYHRYQWSAQKTAYQNIRKWIHVVLLHLPIPAFDILYYLRKEQHRVIHMYQSQYACEYIKAHNLGRSYPLSDYINMELLPTERIDKSKKEDIILYNPRKGLEFTKKIIQALPEYKFVALQGMNRTELNEVFDKAKIYIDFGSFPGKDRLPREAVMHECCIITGRNGASAYFEDVPIDDYFKFDSVDKNIPAIAARIRDIMTNYLVYNKNFDSYRVIVRGEQKAFYKEIEAIFLQNER